MLFFAPPVPCTTDELPNRGSDTCEFISHVYASDEEQVRLLQRRNALRCELAEANIILKEQRASVLTLQERFKNMHRERALVRRKVQLLQNELYQAKRKRELIKTQLDELTPLLATRDQTFRTTNELNRQLEGRQATLDTTVRKLNSRIELMCGKRLELETIVADLETRKVTLIEEISYLLQQAILERDKVEEDLYRVVVEFRDSIIVRDRLFKRQEIQKIKLTDLQTEIELAERRLEILERIQALMVKRNTLSDQIATNLRHREVVEQALENALATVHTKKYQLEKLRGNFIQISQDVDTLQVEWGPYLDAKERTTAIEANIEVCKTELTGAIQDILDSISASYTTTIEANSLLTRITWIAGLQNLLNKNNA